MLAEGHPHASRYPIAKVWYESELVKARVNARIETEAVLLHAAIVSVIAPKGNGVSHFEKLLKDLHG